MGVHGDMAGTWGHGGHRVVFWDKDTGTRDNMGCPLGLGTGTQGRPVGLGTRGRGVSHGDGDTGWGHSDHGPCVCDRGGVTCGDRDRHDGITPESDTGVSCRALCDLRWPMGTQVVSGDTNRHRGDTGGPWERG